MPKRERPSSSGIPRSIRELLAGNFDQQDLRRRLAVNSKRTERVEMRVSVSEKELLNRLAEHYDSNVTDLIIEMAKIVAERTF